MSEDRQGWRLDIDGYPREEDIDRIRTWPLPTPADARLLLSFAWSLWHPTYGGWDSDLVSEGRRMQERYVLTTGGWSGNEEVIAALEANAGHFALFCWWRSERGGLHEYRTVVGPGNPEFVSEIGSETPDSTLPTHESHNTAGIGTGVDERA